MSVAVATIHPKSVIAPGRYLLDDDGRLQPLRYRGFVRAVAVVTVKPKAAAVAASPPAKAAKPAKIEPADDGEVVCLAKPAPKPDWAKISARLSARTPQPRARRPAPASPALSRESCQFCGIPGSRGCDHFLPYEPERRA